MIIWFQFHIKASLNFTSDIRKTQVRFQPKDDVMLLREVLARNPFKNRAAWKEIATELSTLNFQVEPRRVKEIYILHIDYPKK